MSLLDGGIRELFADVFGDIYEDATLIKVTRSESSAGVITETTANHAVKAHAPARSAAYRAAAGFADSEIEIIILKAALSVTPNTDDRLTYKSQTYNIMSAFEDGAHSHWRCRCMLKAS